jgi:hypothetical protein
MRLAGFEPIISAGERMKTNALDRAVTGTSCSTYFHVNTHGEDLVSGAYLNKFTELRCSFYGVQQFSQFLLPEDESIAGFRNVLLLLFFFGSAAQRGLWPPLSRGFFITPHNDAPQSVGLLWTSDQPVAETST